MLLVRTTCPGILCGRVSHRGSCMDRSAKKDVFYLAFPKTGVGSAACWLALKPQPVWVRRELCCRLGRSPAPGDSRGPLSPARGFALWHAEKGHLGSERWVCWGIGTHRATGAKKWDPVPSRGEVGTTASVWAVSTAGAGKRGRGAVLAHWLCQKSLKKESEVFFLLQFLSCNLWYDSVP